MISLEIKTGLRTTWNTNDNVGIGITNRDGKFSEIFVIENLGNDEVRLDNKWPIWPVIDSLTDDKNEAFVLFNVLADKLGKLADDIVLNINSYVDCEVTADSDRYATFLNISGDPKSRVAFAEKLLPVYQEMLNELVTATVPENLTLATETIASIKQYGFDFGTGPFSNMLVHTTSGISTLESVHIVFKYPKTLEIQMIKKSSERDQLWSFVATLGLSAKKSSYGWLTVKFANYEEMCIALETFAKKVEEVFANRPSEVAKRAPKVPVISQEAQELLRSLIRRSDEIVSESEDPYIYDTVESQIVAAIEEFSDNGEAEDNAAAVELFAVLKGKKPEEADPVKDSTISYAELSERILTKLLKGYFSYDYELIKCAIEDFFNERR